MGKYMIRRIVQAIPVIIGITIVIYAIMLLAPGGPQSEFANNPRMTQRAEGRVHQGLGPRPADPHPVLPLGRLLRPRRRGLRLHRPDGLAELPADGDQRRRQRRPPRRPRLLDRLRQQVSERIVRAALPTLILAGFALIIWIGIAILIGVYCRRSNATRSSTKRDDLRLCRLRDPDVLARDHAVFIFGDGSRDPAGQRDGRHPRLAALRHRRLLGLLRAAPDQGDPRRRRST